jgi:hyperosmotically inducible periplasmic protein
MSIATRSDQAIKKDIVDQMYWDGRVDASDVHINIDNGAVTLTGTVPTSRARSAAYDDAWMVDGVTSVSNRITVKYPTVPALPTDSQIKTNVINALADDADIHTYKLDVDVKNNWVTLEGTVPSLWKKMRAEDIAEDRRGVIGVTNKLAVVPTEKVADESIGKKVVDALDRNVNVDVEDIDVKVRDSKVTLTGTVPSYYAKHSAWSSAFYTDGVISVDDQTVVANR